MKRIRLLADLGIEALYDETEGVYLQPTELPLSPQTQAELERWQKEYDATFDVDEPETPSALQVVGQKLADQMIAELGEGYQVTYVPS